MQLVGRRLQHRPPTRFFATAIVCAKSVAVASMLFVAGFLVMRLALKLVAFSLTP